MRRDRFRWMWPARRSRRVDRVAFPAERAIIDTVVPREELRAALSILTACALSEPRLWLRRYGQLSAGEQFRAVLARAIGLQLATDPASPLLCDEFAAVLHRRAARAIAFSLRKLVTLKHLCLVVATSHDDVSADLQPDTVIATQPGAPAVLSERKPQRRPFSIVRRLHIEPGRKADYRHFADMHYRHRDELGFVDRVFVLREGIGGEPLGIIVYAHGPMELSLRNLATRRRFVRNPARLNREVRIIRRIVIHPDVRGCGLGHRLIRETMPRLGVPDVECLAGMGNVNPVFERAGMKRIGLSPVPANRARIVNRLRRLRVDPFRPDFVTRVGRRPRLRALVSEAVSEWYRASTGGGEGRVSRQTPQFLAETFRQLLGSRPVYYLWCRNHEEHERLVVAADGTDAQSPSKAQSASTGPSD